MNPHAQAHSRGRGPLWAAAAILLAGLLVYQLKIDVKREKRTGPAWGQPPPTDADAPENTPAVEEPDAAGWESPPPPFPRDTEAWV